MFMGMPIRLHALVVSCCVFACLMFHASCVISHVSLPSLLLLLALVHPHAHAIPIRMYIRTSAPPMHIRMHTRRSCLHTTCPLFTHMCPSVHRTATNSSTCVNPPRISARSICTHHNPQPQGQPPINSIREPRRRQIDIVSERRQKHV